MQTLFPDEWCGPLIHCGLWLVRSSVTDMSADFEDIELAGLSEAELAELSELIDPDVSKQARSSSIRVASCVVQRTTTRNGLLPLGSL